MIAKLIIIFLAVHIGQSKLCQFVEDNKKALEGIFEAMSINDKRLAAKESGKISSFAVRKFYESLKIICPKASSALIYQDEPTYEPIIGKGGFGTVWDAVIDGEHKAVKQINLAEIILKKLFRKFPLTIQENEKCLHSIENLLMSESLFIEKEATQRLDEKGNEINIFISHLETLKPVNLELLDTPECKLIPGSYETIKQVVEDNIVKLHNEIYVMKEIDKYSTENESPYRSYPKFDYCLVDSDLTVYIINEKLGPSVREVYKVCDGVINEHDLQRRLLNYMGMMYQIYLMHEKGIAHCDIKLDNSLFNNEKLEWIHLIDFGLISANEECNGYTVGYAPPEVFVYKIKSEEVDLEYNTPEYQKQDAFSLAFTILKMELGHSRTSELSKFVTSFETLKNDDLLEDLDDKFQELIDTQQAKLFADRYGVDYKSSQDRSAQIDYEFNYLLTHSLNLFYVIRIPVKALLFLTYKLYITLIHPEMEFKKVDDYFINASELKEELEKSEWATEVARILRVKESRLLI